MDLIFLGRMVAEHRRAAELSQATLAARAHVSLPTLKAFEQGRTPELGFAKILRILTVLGLEVEVREANLGRPTLESLRREAELD
jgi:transcriptional regulator with XRE-family HTH domain